MVPISLLASMMDTRIVLSVIALRSASGSTTPIASTGRYVTWASPCFSSRRQGSSTARCSVTVGDDVVPLLPVHLHDALDRQVVGLGPSRGPDELLGIARADQPGQLLAGPLHAPLRLPAEGVVAAAGMPELLGEVRDHRLEHPRIDGRRRVAVHEDRELHRHAPSPQCPRCDEPRSDGRRLVQGIHRLQGHGLQEPLDAALDGQHRPPDVAALELRALHRPVAVHQAERPLDGAEHLAHADLARLPREDVPALGPVDARDQLSLGQALEDLRQELRRDAEVLGDPLGVDHAVVLMEGDVVHRHQPVVRLLAEP